MAEKSSESREQKPKTSTNVLYEKMTPIEPWEILFLSKATVLDARNLTENRHHYY